MEKTFGGNEIDGGNYFGDIVEVKDGYVIVGSSDLYDITGNNYGSFDGVILKIGINGEL